MAEAVSVILCGGLSVCIRPVRSDDRLPMREFLQRLSEDSRVLRFMSACVDLDAEAACMTEEGPDRFGLVATIGPDGPIVGHAGFAQIGADRAESAVVVADEIQRGGLGTQLLLRLAAVARRRGIEVFEGEVLPENHRLLACLRRSFPVSVQSGPGWMRVEHPTRPSTPEERATRDRAVRPAA